MSISRGQLYSKLNEAIDVLFIYTMMSIAVVVALSTSHLVRVNQLIKKNELESPIPLTDGEVCLHHQRSSCPVLPHSRICLYCHGLSLLVHYALSIPPLSHSTLSHYASSLCSPATASLPLCLPLSLSSPNTFSHYALPLCSLTTCPLTTASLPLCAFSLSICRRRTRVVSSW